MTMTNETTETTVTEYREINFAVDSLVRSASGASYIHKLTRIDKPYRDGNTNRIDSLLRKFDAAQEALRPTSNQAQLDYALSMWGGVYLYSGLLKRALDSFDMTESEFKKIEWVTYRKVIATIVEWRTGHDRLTDHPASATA